MCYMDQGMECSRCGTEHSQFSTGVCLGCQSKEREEKQQAEWNAKTPLEQALYYLQKWADPQAMTFNKHDAKFVLSVVQSLTTQPTIAADSVRDVGLEEALRKIEGFESRIMRKKAQMGFMDEWGAFGYSLEEEEMMAEITELRAAMAAQADTKGGA